MKNPKKRGALFFTIDTMVASIVFTITVVVVFSVYLSEPEARDIYQIVDNYGTYISTTNMENFRNIQRYIYYDANETDLDFYIHQKISKLYYLKNNSIATDFVKNFTDILVPEQLGFQYKLGDIIIYERPSANSDAEINLTTSILTYFFDNETESIIGPNITKVSVWS